MKPTRKKVKAKTVKAWAIIYNKDAPIIRLNSLYDHKWGLGSKSRCKFIQVEIKPIKRKVKK